MQYRGHAARDQIGRFKVDLIDLAFSELALAGVDVLQRAVWREGDGPQALHSALKAIEIDPDYGRAHAYVGFFYGFNLFAQWINPDDDEIAHRARTAIERALAFDRGDPFILQRASMTYLLLGEPETALRYAEVAAAESARDSEMLTIHGMTLAYCGDHTNGRAMIEHAVTLERRLSPSIYLSCQRQSKSEPKGSAKCCHFEVGIISV